MGFSPGDFIDKVNGEVHWELKDGPRVVLWDRYETRKILDLDRHEFLECLSQLSILGFLIEKVN